MEKKDLKMVKTLLLVLVLVIIVVIAVLEIIKLINNGEKNKFKNLAYKIIDVVNTNYQDRKNGDNLLEEVTFNYTNGVETSNLGDYKLEYNDEKPQHGTIIVNEDGKIGLALHNGKYCVEKSYNESEVKLSDKSKEKCEVPVQPFQTCGDILVDSRDQSSYKTVKIGDQCWMSSNLRYTGNGCLDKAWDESEPYDACMTHDSTTPVKEAGNHATWWTKEPIQVLYQWGAVMDATPTEGNPGICPSGWHIPTDDEWKKLEATVDPETNLTDWELAGDYRGTAGSKLKASSPLWNGTGNYGFNALPTGNRHYENNLEAVGAHGYWWTSSGDDLDAWRRGMFSYFLGVERVLSSQRFGSSVRCILGQ